MFNIDHGFKIISAKVWIYIYQIDFYFLNLNRSLKVKILRKKENFFILQR